MNLLTALGAIWRRIQTPLAILGAVGTILAIVQFVRNDLPAKKSVQVIYKHSVLAQPASIFGVDDIEGLGPGGRVIAFDILVWNNGIDPIAMADMRKELAFQFLRGKILKIKYGAFRSATPQNFELASDAEGFKLRWKFFDPGDYFEFHVLFLAQAPNEFPPNQISADGVIAGNNRIEASGQHVVTRWRVVMVALVVLLFFVFAGRIFDPAFDYSERANLQFVHYRLVSFTRFLLFMTVAFGPLLAAIFIVYAISSKIFWAPIWLEPLF